jgi:hypothetical protein
MIEGFPITWIAAGRYGKSYVLRLELLGLMSLLIFSMPLPLRPCR